MNVPDSPASKILFNVVQGASGDFKAQCLNPAIALASPSLEGLCQDIEQALLRAYPPGKAPQARNVALAFSAEGAKG